MSKTKPAAEHTVTEALASQADTTAAELAAATGLGRSTVSKALAKLERAGTALRAIHRDTGGARQPDRWSLSATRRRQPTSGERLRPGELDALVLDYLRRNADHAPLGPTAIANGLRRSSGAVANCLARLAITGRVREVTQRPRRYHRSEWRRQRSTRLAPLGPIGGSQGVAANADPFRARL